MSSDKMPLALAKRGHYKVWMAEVFTVPLSGDISYSTEIKTNTRPERGEDSMASLEGKQCYRANYSTVGLWQNLIIVLSLKQWVIIIAYLIIL